MNNTLLSRGAWRTIFGGVLAGILIGVNILSAAHGAVSADRSGSQTSASQSVTSAPQNTARPSAVKAQPAESVNSVAGVAPTETSVAALTKGTRPVLSGSSCAPLIDDVLIMAAQQQITDEVARLRRTQLMRTCAAATVVAIGGYGLYCWWQRGTPVVPTREFATQTDLAGTQADLASAHLQPTSAVPGPGFFSWVGSSLYSLTKNFSYLFASMAVGTAAAVTTTRALDKTVHMLFKTYDWKWLMRERTQLYILLWDLKCAAAMLDPKSTEFDALKNIQLVIAEQPMAGNPQGQLMVATVDELLKLHVLVQRTNDSAHRAQIEQHLKSVWQLIVQAITLGVGFMQDKAQHSDVVPFDYNCLKTARALLINQTNALTQQLDQLCAQTTDEQSAGLLVRVYKYCNTVSQVCSALESNCIVGTGE